MKGLFFEISKFLAQLDTITETTSSWRSQWFWPQPQCSTWFWWDNHLMSPAYPPLKQRSPIPRSESCLRTGTSLQFATAKKGFK